jgi:hypothetical protein
MKKLVLFCIAIFCSSPAFSSLVEKDLYQQNDRLITLDTISGLEWLDITKTQGMSYSDVRSDTILKTGDWEHATNYEVLNLFTGYLRSDNFQQIQNYFGITMEITEPGLYHIKMTHGFIEHLDGRSLYGDAFIKYFLSGGESIWEVRNFSAWDPDRREPNVGHWMVRQSAVPIPGAVWLLGSGLIGLASLKAIKIKRQNL